MIQRPYNVFFLLVCCIFCTIFLRKAGQFNIIYIASVTIELLEERRGEEMRGEERGGENRIE